MLAVATLLASSAAAGPSIFISSGRGEAWWNAVSVKGSISGKLASGVSAAALSKYIEQTEEFYPYRICALAEVKNDTYAGVDRATQEDIGATLKFVNWRVQGVTPNGRRIVAQSVLYEACDEDENRGAAVLVTDAATSEIMLFEPMGPGSRNGKSVPIWTAFLDKPDPRTPDAPVFSFSACTECGASTAVYYDVTRKKLYKEYNGH